MRKGVRHKPNLRVSTVTGPKQVDDALSGIQRGIFTFAEGQDMGRRRLQQKGDLYQQGGWWKLRWREDQLLPDGSSKYGWSKPAWIGPALGRGRLTEKEAPRSAWD